MRHSDELVEAGEHVLVLGEEAFDEKFSQYPEYVPLPIELSLKILRLIADDLGILVRLTILLQDSLDEQRCEVGIVVVEQTADLNDVVLVALVEANF